MITQKTRQLSFEDIKPKRLTKYIKILNVLGNEQLTAREIMKRTGARDMNEVRPRITELESLGFVTTEKTKKCSITNKEVAVYRETTNLEKMIFENENHIPSY